MSIVKQEDLEKLMLRVTSLENRLGNVNYEMKGVVKSELVANAVVVEQPQMQFGLYTALCIDTIDIWKQNRVRWFSPMFHDPERPVQEFPWAKPVSSMGGFDDCGLSWVPPAGCTLCILFENGNRASPYYIGTAWHRNRGPDGNHNWGIHIPEYLRVSEGHRKGYLVGPDDGSQVFPPWNTESYNGFDLTSVVDFAEVPEAQKLITYPNIYGFKTPEKHMIKMVDGDPKCNRKWKRFEIMSSCGNWIMLKDDHLHYSGQWAHTSCGVKPGDTSCVEDVSAGSDIDDLRGGFDVRRESPENAGESEDAQTTNILPRFGEKKENTSCDEGGSCGGKSNKKIIGGHPSTSAKGSTHINSQVGANPYFKHRQECRPYKGTPTNQNTKSDLPQSGIQIMSISGHTFVMDDSVQEPFGDPIWEREFDFGCTNIFEGRTYWQSATGHRIEMSDVELDCEPCIRENTNWIKILTATGNKIELNDHTLPGCIAGEERGIHIQSTSNHTIDMVDDTNKQCSPCKREGGTPTPNSNKAFVRIRTGYGLEMHFGDDFDQQETQQQYIQIFCPHKDNCRGPHIHRYQEAPSGPGLVFLRVAGNYVVTTTDDHITVVGDIGECSPPSNMVEIISKIKLVYAKDFYINITEKSHLFLAKERIILLAGRDCKDWGCPAPILVYDPCKGCVCLSNRVIASSCGGSPVSIFMLKPFSKC